MEFIVGTALAGIPIVLEAYEYYWKISAGFSTFRRYTSELSKLDTIIRTQMTLFRGNVVRVLTVLTDDPKMAQEILSNGRPIRLGELDLLDIQVNSRRDLLRGMFFSWEATLQLVLSAILEICHEFEGLQPETSSQMERSASKDILKYTLNRVRLCWKKESVQNSIKELRSFTTDFNELTTRIVDDIREIKNDGNPGPGHKSHSTAIEQDSLELYRQIRAASSTMYEIFSQRWACTRHHKHALNISLAGTASPDHSDLTERCISFNVAVDCACGYSWCRETPVWVEVEAVNTISPGSQDGLEQQLENHLPELGSKNVLTTLIENLTPYSRPMFVGNSKKGHNKLVEKDLRHQVMHPTLAPSNTNTPAPSAQITRDKQSDSDVNHTSMLSFEDIQDHCGHFGTQTRQSMIFPRYVGLIKEPNLHRFHVPPPGRQLPNQQRSLEEIIVWLSEDDFTRNLSRKRIINLSYSLATVVLQYHSTPWLPDFWKSSQVRFFTIDKLPQTTNGISSLTPYLRVEFSGPDKERAQSQVPGEPQAHQNTTTKSLTLARNAVLFCLGIMLLELGYSKPWIQLQKWAFHDLPLEKQTDYHAAERLAQASGLRNRMGPRFPTIVRKCLGCDFGLGENDLANEKLQGVFLVDVIMALKGVEKGLIDLEKQVGEC